MKAQKNKKQYKMNVGDNIRVWRELEGFKQNDLATKVGISPTALSNIETGASKPNIERLEDIADALEIEVNQLLFNPQQMITFNNSPQSNAIVYGDSTQLNTDKEIISKLTVVMEKITDFFTSNKK